MTIEEFRAWAQSQGSVAKYTDGKYLGECVSLVNQYLARVNGIQAGAWGNAKDWATNGTVAQYFDKVSSPQAGDIGVSGATSTNPYGHIWIYLTPNLVLEQNGRVARKVSVNAPLFKPIAILRRKGASPGGNVAGIPNEDAWYWRFNKLMDQIRGRTMTREEFQKNFVGTEAFRMVEILSDSTEADTATNWQNVGRLAVADRWDQQIYSLQDQVKALSTRPTRAELDAVQKQAEELTASVEAAKAQAKAAQEENERLKAEQTEDTELLNQAGSWFTKLFNRLFKKG